jgi:long-chain fatty acid transport protein
MKSRSGPAVQAVSLSALAFLLSSLLLAPAAFATNGMNLEGYGPIATGMGGASMAYDNGAAAVMNNPATLGLMPEGNRLDVALGFLRPDVTSKMTGMPDATSSGDLYVMPAAGWIQKSGSYAYGVGIFAQGGMGTEYSADSFVAMGSGDEVRSELGVGRFIVPFAYDVNENLVVAASLDYVWASLDLKMAATGAQLGSLVTNCTGAGCAALPGLAGASWARIDFSGGGDYSGAAKSTGFAGKLGLAYKINEEITVGATYHSKTSLDDLETDDTGAIMSAAGFGTVGAGKIKVRDFQWPETYGIGVAWKANKQVLVAFDVKQIQWKDVMKDFKMTYEGSLGGAPGNVLDLSMPQNWKNQTVFELGAAFQVNEPLVLRAGVNIASNPIPDDYMNPLFPAIEENHFTIGAGYTFDQASSVDLSLAFAPEVEAKNSDGVTTTHSQFNQQIMYSFRF